MRNDDMIIRDGNGRCIIVIDRQVVYDGPERECPKGLMEEASGFSCDPVMQPESGNASAVE